MRYYVRDHIKSHIIPAIDGGVFKSDTSVPTPTRTDLVHAIATLRAHKGSQIGRADDTVQDLVDPFSFPFMWERTRTLRQGWVSRMDCISRCGEGESVKSPPEDDCRQDNFAKYRNDMAWSRRYQWLPFNVSFEDDGRGPSRYVSHLSRSLYRPLIRDLLAQHRRLYQWCSSDSQFFPLRTNRNPSRLLTSSL